MILETPADFTFYLAVLSVLFSLFIILRLISYFRATGSREYLLIAFIFLWYAYTNFLIIQVVYIEFFPDDWYNRSPNYWRAYPWVGMFFIMNTLGSMALLLHCVRTRDFNSQSRLYKIVAGYIGLELILQLPAILIHYVETIMTQNWAFSGITGQWMPYKWYMTVFPSYLYIKDVSPVANTLYTTLPTILTYLFLIYTYLTIKPEIKTKSILSARIAWIGLAIPQLFYDILTALINSRNPDWINDNLLWTFQISNIVHFVTITSILLLILLYPEIVLVTKEQIFRAKKLYNIIQNKREFNPGIPLANMSQHFSDYIASLPSDYIVELKEK